VLLTRAGALFVESVERRQDGFDMNGGLVVQAGPDADGVKAKLEQLQNELLPGGVERVEVEGFDLDISLLPPASVIARHLQPCVTVVRRSESGVELQVRQTMPCGNIGASVPVAAALLLPAVQSARTAARQAQAANNLKQIGLALHNYRDTYRGFPAAYNTDKEGKPLRPARPRQRAHGPAHGRVSGPAGRRERPLSGPVDRQDRTQRPVHQKRRRDSPALLAGLSRENRVHRRLRLAL
jgi:hypothetical protein